MGRVFFLEIFDAPFNFKLHTLNDSGADRRFRVISDVQERPLAVYQRKFGRESAEAF